MANLKLSPFLRSPRGRGLTILIVTFLMAAGVTMQLKSALIPASNRVARDQELVNSVRALEKDNSSLQAQIRATQTEIKGLNSQLASTSTEARSAQLAGIRQRNRAGLTRATGPGLSVELANGRDPKITGDEKQDWRVKYLDIQDVVNLLWSGGAEAVAVNGQRVVASSSFYVAGSDVLLNGVHLRSPYRLEATGSSSELEQVLADQGKLTELKNRSELYQLKLSWKTERSLGLPAYDGPTLVRYAVAGP